MRRIPLAACLALVAVLGGAPSPARAQQDGQGPNAAQQHLAALKKIMAQSQQNLRTYEWIQTTVVSLKGEEKSRSVERCYYGADGKLQKVPVAPPPEPEKRRGLRGKIVEKKKEEMSEYMKAAVQQVHLYVPPDPALLQRSKDNSKLSIAVLEPGKRVRLDFGDYVVPGDVLGIELDLAANRPTAATVSTFLTDPEKDSRDPVKLQIRFGTLPDGTTFAEQIDLSAPAKHLNVDVSNSGHRKTGGD